MTTKFAVAGSAYRIGAFGLWLDDGRPNLCRFCFRPTDSAGKRVLFFLFAATAKVRVQSIRARKLKKLNLFYHSRTVS
jgi:hypothetical protein